MLIVLFLLTVIGINVAATFVINNTGTTIIIATVAVIVSNANTTRTTINTAAATATNDHISFIVKLWMIIVIIVNIIER